MPNAAAIQIARNTRNALAGQALTTHQAKLYSQRLRRDMSGEGLPSFRPEEVHQRLEEALLLLQCGLIERSADEESSWRDSVKRAAEIFEWLSQKDLKPDGTPLHLLAAGAYQLAEYPAMALGHLRKVPDNEPMSAVLRDFMRAGFPAVLEAIRLYWQAQLVREHGDVNPHALTEETFHHVIMCIGTITAYLRTGASEMIAVALDKLDRLAVSLHYSRDAYSYALAVLTSASARRFAGACLWPRIAQLRETSSPAAGKALEQFARAAFANGRALVWPAQAAGIDRLRENGSFVLCTPTGSGKTTIATIAVIQALFEAPRAGDLMGLLGLGPANLVLYLVPSRALAAEVEGRFAQDLQGIAADPLVITGLYGGVDWGPTDAWIQSDTPTVVICTFEKADALVRNLSTLFLSRVRLVVIDEVHMVEQQREREGLSDGTSRAFRLEQLGARLLRARRDHGFRVVALSAVAARAAPALARWIGGNADDLPVSSTYRSTRQMIGRLEVDSRGAYTIRYDLMDGRSLVFEDEGRDDTPYVRAPFTALPDGVDEKLGPEKKMRAPTLWAALHLAAERPDGSCPSVLISLTQSIADFASTCADAMDEWPARRLPKYWPGEDDDEVWQRCLASAADYFTEESVEYRLLKRGIAVHHGKMPGLLARRLKRAIDRGRVRVIIATSTLSEGVNMPVNYILLPSVCRGAGAMPLQEFTNLVGRAGRPGFGVEGSALVVLPEPTVVRRGRRFVPEYNRQRVAYDELVAQATRSTAAAVEGAPEDQASSALAQLLTALAQAWSDMTGSMDGNEFVAWLEQTAVIGEEATDDAYGYLESLDAFLIAAIQEMEELRGAEIPANEMEAQLKEIWEQTYAHAAQQEEANLAAIWLGRGKVIKNHYADPDQRKRIYKTSLQPRSAVSLWEYAEEIRTKLQTGVAYGTWSREERFDFIAEVIELLSQVPAFEIGKKLGRKRTFNDWESVLRWWLDKETLDEHPEPKAISDWYDFVASNFIYRATWGLGSLIGVLLDQAGGAPIRALEMDDWPRSGLPWIAFWMKELLTWGTLDPVAAYLLARGDAVDRPRAETAGAAYYKGLPRGTLPNDMLDPRQIRDWVNAQHVRAPARAAAPGVNIPAALVRPAAEFRAEVLPVLPLEQGGDIVWADPAGYAVARSARPEHWPAAPASFEFQLLVGEARVEGAPYLPHA